MARKARHALHVPQLQGLFRIDPTVEPDEVAIQIERTWDQIAAPLYQFLRSLQDSMDATQAKDDHNDLLLRDVYPAHPASAISFVPYGNLEAEDVQSAIEELDREKLGHVRTMIRVSVGF